MESMRVSRASCRHARSHLQPPQCSRSLVAESQKASNDKTGRICQSICASRHHAQRCQDEH